MSGTTEQDPFFRSKRRAALSRHPMLMGIDYVEVKKGPSQGTWQLELYFIPAAEKIKKNTVRPKNITKVNISILEGSGGEQNNLNVTEILEGESYDKRLIITLEEDKPGIKETENTSTYLLKLVGLSNIDRFFGEIKFSLQAADKPSRFDPKPVSLPDTPVYTTPEIDYLAKDYSSFRELMLDRLSFLMPQWQEATPADLVHALVEVLAFGADRLSYYQDAVASEAYLGTARRRTSVRRHARLIDYSMHEGCNARVWVQVQVNQKFTLEQGTKLLTKISGRNDNVFNFEHYQEALRLKDTMVFEVLHERELVEKQNEIHIYTYGQGQFVLPQGATSATLCGNLSQTLKAGDVIIFEERVGVRTGQPADANPQHRHAVRLTEVLLEQDPLGDIELLDSASGTISSQGQLVIGNNQTAFKKELKEGYTIIAAGQTRVVKQIYSEHELKINAKFEPDLSARTPFRAMHITKIQWHKQDALPFDLTISTREPISCQNITVVRGNIVLADHGRTIPYEEVHPPTVPNFGRYRPHLQRTNLTYRVCYDHSQAQKEPAGMALCQKPGQAMPFITLQGGGSEWTPRRDLLDSNRFRQDFVVEMESDGRAYLRFGDGLRGQKPAPGTSFKATYRIGKGLEGNVGRNAIAHLVAKNPQDQSATAELKAAIKKVCNYLPAQGGIDPELLSEVRLYAPQEFQTQERGVIDEDFVTLVERHPEVQKAKAIRRWNGSWYTIQLVVQRKDYKAVDAAFRKKIFDFMDHYRVLGYDITISAPRFVPLDLALIVDITSAQLAETVKQRLLETFSAREFPNGQRGFFHPDCLSLGESVYLSKIVSQAVNVPDVLRVQIDRFQRWGQPAQREKDKDAGVIKIGPLEIARLDNDSRAPQHGQLELNIKWPGARGKGNTRE